MLVVFINHAARNPVVTIIRGIILFRVEMFMGSWIWGRIHKMADPETIDIDAKNSIGVVNEAPSSS